MNSTPSTPRPTWRGCRKISSHLRYLFIRLLRSKAPDGLHWELSLPHASQCFTPREVPDDTRPCDRLDTTADNRKSGRVCAGSSSGCTSGLELPQSCSSTSSSWCCRHAERYSQTHLPGAARWGLEGRGTEMKLATPLEEASSQTSRGLPIDTEEGMQGEGC